MRTVLLFPVKASFRRTWRTLLLAVASGWVWSTTFTSGLTLESIYSHHILKSITYHTVFAGLKLRPLR